MPYEDYHMNFFKESFTKNGIEIPEERWMLDLINDYMDDHGEVLDEDDVLDLKFPYYSGSGHFYEHDVYYECDSAKQVIDVICDEGCTKIIECLLSELSNVPENILRETLVGLMLPYSAGDSQIKYHNGKYRF